VCSRCRRRLYTAFAGLHVVAVSAGGHSSAAIVADPKHNGSNVDKQNNNDDDDDEKNDDGAIDVLICSWNVNDNVTV
jgi:hypothetical protein